MYRVDAPFTREPISREMVDAYEELALARLQRSPELYDSASDGEQLEEFDRIRALAVLYQGRPSTSLALDLWSRCVAMPFVPADENSTSLPGSPRHRQTQVREVLAEVERTFGAAEPGVLGDFSYHVRVRANREIDRGMPQQDALQERWAA